MVYPQNSLTFLKKSFHKALDYLITNAGSFEILHGKISGKTPRRVQVQRNTILGRSIRCGEPLVINLR